MALLMVMGVAYAGYVKQQSSGDSELDPDIHLEGKTGVTLLPLEQTLSVFEAPMASIAFFDGSYQSAAEYLRPRMADIVKKNPWLGGWLLKAPGEKEMKLWFDPSSDDLAPNIFRVYEPGDIPLSRNNTLYSDYDAIVREHGAKVPSNKELMGRNIPIFQLSVIPDAEAPEERFALVASMSHVGGDPHTFFMIYNMLYKGTNIFELNPMRKLLASESIMNRMGKQETFYISQAVANPVWRPSHKKEEEDEEDKMQMMIFHISQAWLDEREEALSGIDKIESGGEKMMNPTGQHVVSTYALLASWFFKKVSASVGLMTCSVRNKLLDCDVNDCDAGNYQNPIPLTSIDYATPQLVSKALETGRRCGSVPPEPLPRFQWDKTFSVATDWSDYYETSVDIGSDDDMISEVQQIPLYDTKDLLSLPNKLSLIVLFTARGKNNRVVGEGGDSPRKFGALVVAPKSVHNKIKDCGIVEGDVIFESKSNIL
eukprot:scaffold49463_cov47-Attheya_sp.AAC.2